MNPLKLVIGAFWCSTSDVLVDEAVSLVPAYFRPDLQAPLQDRVLVFVNTFRAPPLDPGELGTWSAVVAWLQSLQPGLRCMEAVLRQLIPRYIMFINRERRLGIRTLGDLEIYSGMFIGAQKLGNWLWRRLLLAAESGEVEVMWQEVMKGSIVARYLEMASVEEIRWSLFRLCEQLLLSDNQELRHTNEFWMEICESGNLETIPERMSAAELHLLMVALRATRYHEMSRSDVARISLNVYTEFVKDGDELVSVDMLEEVKMRVPIEFNPMGKYLCVRFKVLKTCERLLHTYSDQYGGYYAVNFRLSGFYPLLTQESIPTSLAFHAVPVGFEFDYGFLPFDLRFEYARLGAKLTRIFQIIASSNDLKLWPGYDRLLRVSNLQEFVAELSVVSTNRLSEFMRIIRQLCRFNPSCFRCQHLQSALLTFDVNSLQTLGFSEFDLVSLAQEFLQIGNSAGNFLQTNSVDLQKVPFDNRECCVCLDEFSEAERPPVLFCPEGAHFLCRPCASTLISSTHPVSCPKCRRDIHVY